MQTDNMIWARQCANYPELYVKVSGTPIGTYRVTFIDTKTLSGAEGWQVEAAARALKAGWSLEKILALVERVREATDTI